MRTAAILPVKRFPVAKQRLGASVAERLRLSLVKAMVGDVLSALRDCRAIEATIVVTAEPSVAAAAHYIGALVVEDSAQDGQSAAVSLGVERASKAGFERVLCVPGDCPALDPGELEALLHDHDGGPAVVIVPDRHGSGTNGLLLRPPDAIVPSFGEGSRARHERLAEEAAVDWRLAEPSSLLLDVDTSADLQVLRERLANERTWAPRTRAVLSDEGSAAAGGPWPPTAAGERRPAA
jgi:2-phospho-L-lactate guanylyltransferase